MKRALKQLSGRRRQTAGDLGVLGELRLLRSRVPHLTGAVAIGSDGTLLAHDAPGTDAGTLATLTTSALVGALRLADGAGRGRFRELLVRGEEGYLAAYAAGPAAVLAVLAEPHANVGRIHLEARRAGTRIADLVEGAGERPEKTRAAPRPHQGAGTPRPRPPGKP
ncbi:roadblock/LC7 domain-containing protein [Streptomyces glaucosporus]|uniref:Roadblock/LC7 domain-containing protein n=1 Tax=Streptomyces glaucosporus TaxID=284044 RepID=A0ABP5V2T2_9ACTN